jgi:phosphatidylserine/phosphatidylglycerophosphate/cardiolipin synthase-like enzyme
MKKLILPTSLIICFSLVTALGAHVVDLTLNNAPAQVYFSPRGGCTDAIINELDQGKSEVLVQAFSFTSAPIAKALLKAYKRGVKVEVILDRSQRTGRYSAVRFFTNQGIPTFIDDRHAIAHNKVMIIDREIVITGSFNFTKAAEENNAENLLIIKSNDLPRIYLENWEKHKDHPQGY